METWRDLYIRITRRRFLAIAAGLLLACSGAISCVGPIGRLGQDGEHGKPGETGPAGPPGPIGPRGLGSKDGQGSGPLRILSSNPRYFTDGSGKAIYLTGSHNWNTFQVWQLDLSPGVDYNSYLVFLKNHKHNYIRLWVADSAWNSSDGNFIEPQPFQRTGPGFAADGRLKFDLTKLNQAYFDQIRQQVISARNNGIYVGVMLFNVWGAGRYNPYSVAGWEGSPFRDGNNVNGISADADADGKGLEVHSLDDPAITAIQEAYVRKILETLNDLDNVIYEIMNEGLGNTISWQYHFLNFVRNVEASLPKRHLVGMTGGDFPNHHLFKSSADWISPSESDSSNPYSDNPSATDGSKVSLLDTDHTYNNAAGDWAPCCWADSKWVWRSFTRGHSPIYMDPMDLTQSNGIDSRHQYKADGNSFSEDRDGPYAQLCQEDEPRRDGSEYFSLLNNLLPCKSR